MLGVLGVLGAGEIFHPFRARKAGGRPDQRPATITWSCGSTGLRNWLTRADRDISFSAPIFLIFNKTNN
jgi:hypothetical protein